jgi:hypothetical protein
MSLPSPEDPTLVLKNQCVGSLYEFLDASAEVWPECPAIKKYLEMFKAAKALDSPLFTVTVYDKLVEYKELFERMQNKDLSVFQEPIEIFQELDIFNKLSDASEEVKDTCWAYITQIVQTASLSRVYGTAPTVMLEKVSKVAEGFMKKMEDGTFDIKEIDPMQLTQMLMDGVDKKEMEAWATSVMNPQSIQSLMGVMKNVMGSKGEEAFDMSSLMSMAGKMPGMGSEEGMDSALIQQMMGSMMKNLKK